MIFNPRSTLALFAFLFSVSSWAIEFKSPSELVNVDLISFRKRFLATSSADEIRQHNQRTFLSLSRDMTSFQRPTSISLAYAKNLHRSMFQHPVVGQEAIQYQRQTVKIGYCFGRATYAHLALLKLGLDPRSILKIWAVGPLQTATDAWDFHVATIARGPQGEWFAMDTYNETAIPVGQWMSLFNSLSTDGKVLFFVTEPSKFTAELGSYDRIQLGLDLNSGVDWYQNYFKDLMKWFSRDQEALKYFRFYQLPPLGT